MLLLLKYIVLFFLSKVINILRHVKGKNKEIVCEKDKEKNKR